VSGYPGSSIAGLSVYEVRSIQRSGLAAASDRCKLRIAARMPVSIR
jgi:hypothetical protein